MPGAAAISSMLPARRAFAGRWIRGAGFRPRVLQSLQRDAAVLGLRAEAQFVYVVDDLAEVVAALDLVFDLAKDFANLVFDGVRPAGLLRKTVKIGKKLAADEVAKVVAGLCPVVVNLAILALGCGPLVPAVGLVEKEGVLFAVEGGFIGFVLLEGVEVFQEKEPGGLLGVVQLRSATGLFAEDVVNVLEGLFKHDPKDYSQVREPRLCSSGMCCWGKIDNSADPGVIFLSAALALSHARWPGEWMPREKERARRSAPAGKGHTRKTSVCGTCHLARTLMLRRPWRSWPRLRPRY